MVGSEILKICAKILEVLGRRTRGGSLIVYQIMFLRIISDTLVIGLGEVPPPFADGFQKKVIDTFP